MVQERTIGLVFLAIVLIIAFPLINEEIVAEITGSVPPSLTIVLRIGLIGAIVASLSMAGYIEYGHR